MSSISLDTDGDSTTDTEKSFEFALLPFDLQRMVAEKMEFFSFNILKKSSKGMQSLCERSEQGGFLPEFHIEWMDIRDNNILCHWVLPEEGKRIYDRHATSFRMISAATHCKMVVGMVLLKLRELSSTIEMLRGRNVSIGRLMIDDDETSCDSDVVADFVENFEVESLDICLSSLLDPDSLLRQPAVKNLRCLNIKRRFDPNEPSYSMEYLLPLRSTSLDLPRIELHVIRTYLKEWLEGNRDIEYYYFTRITDVPSHVSDFLSEVQSGVFSDLCEREVSDDEEDMLGYWHAVTTKLRRPNGNLAVEFQFSAYNSSISFSATNV